MKKAIFTRAGVIASLAFLASGCGQTNETTEESSNADGGKPVKTVDIATSEYNYAHKWGVSRVGRESILISAAIPHCENAQAEPQWEKIAKRWRRGDLILTAFMRIPPLKGSACLGVELYLMHWVKIGKDLARLNLYDGSTSPPARRKEADLQMRAHSGHSQRRRPVQWRVFEEPTETTVEIRNSVGFCSGSHRVPRISGVRQEDHANSVVLTAYLAGRPPHSKSGMPCAGGETIISSDIHIRGGLNGRPLYDGSQTPPVKRWPR